MADKEKKKKPKKKEEPAAPKEEPAPAPEPEPEPAKPSSQTASQRASSRGSRKAKRSGSSVFSMFSQKQVAEFKENNNISGTDPPPSFGTRTRSSRIRIMNREKLPDLIRVGKSAKQLPGNAPNLLWTDLQAFQLMDHDKDGIIGKEDLRSTMDSLGKLATEKELDEMIGEAPGPINFTQLLNLFAARMSGGSDDDDVVINAFNTYDVDGKIDGERLRHALLTWGDKFTPREVNDAYDQMYIDDKGFIDTPSLIAMLTGTGEDEDE